jgi:membrane protease YdiL (CAAX protease family)
MLSSDKPWKLEAALMLGAGMFLILSLGSLAGIALKWLWPELRVVDLRFCQFVLGTVTLQGGALVLTHAFLRQHDVTWSEFLGLDHPGVRHALARALAVAAVATPAVLALAHFSAAIITLLKKEVEPQSAIQVLELSVGPFRRALFIVAGVVLAPVAEEILFRGVLYATIKEQGFPRLALVISSLLFAAVHLSWLVLVPFTFLAVVLAFLYEKTGRLLAPIVAHASFNAINVVFHSVTHRAGG